MGLKFFFAKNLLLHSEKYDIMSNQNHGSKPGRTVHDPLLIQTLIYDLVRINRQRFNMLFMDADGCYDRIRPNVATIAFRRKGCPANIAYCNALTHIYMIHRIRTAFGISIEASFPTEERGGIGQGGGNGPLQ